jgi:hypothetical protein
MKKFSLSRKLKEAIKVIKGEEGNLSVPPNVGQTEEFQEGVLARQQGLKDIVACPHLHGDLRCRWMSGYWNEDVRRSMINRSTSHDSRRIMP